MPVVAIFHFRTFGQVAVFQHFAFMTLHMLSMSFLQLLTWPVMTYWVCATYWTHVSVFKVSFLNDVSVRMEVFSKTMCLWMDISFKRRGQIYTFKTIHICGQGLCKQFRALTFSLRFFLGDSIGTSCGISSSSSSSSSPLLHSTSFSATASLTPS